MLDVACVGILVADVLAKPVDKIPAKGLLGLVDSIELFSGGNAMTAAVNLTRMGLKSAIVGKIGNDPFGAFLEQRLTISGVDTTSLVKDETVQTATSVALSDSDGERTFLHCVGANGTFDSSDVNWQVIADAKIVFVTGTFLLNRFDGEQTVAFLKKCKEMGKITALDVCWDSKERWATILNPAMPYIDIFMPSIDEAVCLSGKNEPSEIAEVFFQNGVKSVIIKLGKQGCYARENQSEQGVVLPTYKNVKVVDTTGAGDSFCSGFLAALAKGNNFIDSAKFANAAGTHCVMAKGATTGMKSYDEILEFMEANHCGN